MKLGTIIHGVLLAAMLLFAYQTWTREDKPETTTGKVKVWDTPAASIAAVVYEENDTDNPEQLKRRVRVERRADGDTTYLWAIEKRFSPKVKKKPGEDGDEPEPPDADEVIEHSREYAVGDAGDEMLEFWSKLRALHDLGDVSDIAAQEYGLDESTKAIVVEIDGGTTKKLILGDRVQGGSDRYVLDPETNRGYVLASTVVGSIEAGEPKLKLKNLHSFTDDKLAKIELKSGNDVRSLVRIETKDDKGKPVKNWADATDTSKPNQTMANFVKRLGDLQPSQFEPEMTTDGLELILVATYQDGAGGTLGTLELYKKVTEPEPVPEPDPAPDATEGDGAEGDDAAKKPGDADAKKAGDADAKKDGDAADAKQDGDAADGDADAADEPPAMEPPKPQPTIEYYLRTQRTRVLASVPKVSAERVDADLPTVFE